MTNNLLFCEDCSELTEKAVCPKCGKPTRHPKDGDMCFVEEFGEMGKSMFADALNNNDVEFIALPVHCGFTQYNTPKGYKIYVRYRYYDTAIEILNTIFGGQDGDQTDKPLKNEDWIDRIVKVTIDRPKGSVHPNHPNIKYELNYGYIEGVVGGDGEWQDAYILDYCVSAYVGKQISGYVVAVIVRKNDTETKWVVSVGNCKRPTREQIAKAVHFQEKFFDIEIIM